MKILITGASSGIGFLTGCVLGNRGHDVFMTTKTSEEQKVLKEKIQRLGLNIDVFKLDITEHDDQNKILGLDLDVLVLHAGVGYSGLLRNMDVNLIRDNFEVNVFSNLEIIQKYLNNNNKPKKIIMTSSLFSNHVCPYFGSYILTKSCIEHMSKILYKESLFTKDKFVILKPGAYHTGFNQYMILTGEKSNVSPIIINFINKLFFSIESKKINSIVEKLVYAIERGRSFKYTAPLWQSLLMDK